MQNEINGLDNENNKKRLSINYSCQSGEDKNVFECLSDEERKQLSAIVKKLFFAGVRLQIKFKDF